MKTHLINKSNVSADEKDALEILLKMCSEELFGVGNVRIDDFIESHYAIYLIVDRGYDVVGFTSYLISDSYGMNEPAVLNDFLYILKEYRNSEAIYRALMATGELVEFTNLPLEHCYASNGSEKLSRKLDGKKLYSAYRYQREEVLREYSRLKKIIERKSND